jgi:hypothetical protein
MVFRNQTDFNVSPSQSAFVKTRYVYLVAHAVPIFRVPSIPNYVGSRFLLNVGNHLQDYTVSESTSPHSSPWKPQISSDVWLCHHASIYRTSSAVTECTTLSWGRLHVNIPSVTPVWVASGRFIEPQVIVAVGYMHYTRVEEAAAPTRRNVRDVWESENELHLTSMQILF